MTNNYSKQHKLYWIYDDRIPHQCPSEHGYIGVTSGTLGERLHGHRYNAINSPERATAKTERNLYGILGDIPTEHIKIKEIVWSYNEDIVLMLEKALRPEPNIGWNKQTGGVKKSKTQKIRAISPNGDHYNFRSIYQAAKETGINSGNISHVLKGRIDHTKEWRFFYAT